VTSDFGMLIDWGRARDRGLETCSACRTGLQHTQSCIKQRQTGGELMRSTSTSLRRTTLAAGLIAVLAASGWVALAAEEMRGGKAEPVFTTELPNVPGKRLTAIVVRYAPGAVSPPHRHAGSVYAYVLSGTIRSQNSATGPVKDFKVGESFFEPPDSHHLISMNASTTEPASLLAILVADDGAVLTTPEN
jgi:quercetin dioxygenase-like cupin family protein